MITNITDLRNAVAAGGRVKVSDSISDRITITEPILVDRPTYIIGGHFEVPSGIGFLVKYSRVTFDEPKFYGRGTSAEYDSTTRFIYAEGTNMDIMLEDIKIRHARMQGSTGDNIRFKCVRDSSLIDNSIKDFLYSGVMMLSCDGINVDNNNIRDDVMKGPVVNTYGIAASDTSNTIAARSRNITISNNQLSNLSWEGIDTHGGEKIVITGNILNDCVRGIALVVGNDKRLTVPQRCVVTGNYVYGNGSSREGISLFGLPGNPADATITGNTVEGYSNPLHLSYYDRARTRVSGNSVPQVDWTPLTLTGDYTANSSYPPEYMVDNDTVHFRGFVIPSSGAGIQIGAIPSAYTPSRYTFMSTTKAATTASSGTGTIAIHPSGAIYMLYRTTSDSYSYAIDGSYKMI